MFFHPTGKLVPPSVYLDEATPNIHITVVDGNVHLFEILKLCCFSGNSVRFPSKCSTNFNQNFIKLIKENVN